ncbi:DnaJ domain-containing protein [Roseivirga sp. BDSF3-8]|uniref:DnaJ domain-containing protein n=1 Tax=Roseivirga sp. BDSF3-8 TaxID=3241598 RepID=UPI0035319949
MREYYLQILDLGNDATKEDIRKAYRNKSKKYHPDVNKSQDAAELFHRIKEAYDYLTKEPELHQTVFQEEEELSEREKWRIIARQRAKERAIEQQRYQQELIRKIVKYFTPAACIIIMINGILALDFMLPFKSHEQEIVDRSAVFVGNMNGRGSYISEEYRYDELIFSDYTMRFDKRTVPATDQYDHAVVKATSLLNIPMKALITINGVTKQYRQAYNIYYIFGYVIPPMLLTGLLFFRLKKPMARLNAAIVMFIFSIYQLMVFFL